MFFQVKVVVFGNKNYNNETSFVSLPQTHFMGPESFKSHTVNILFKSLSF